MHDIMMDVPVGTGDETTQLLKRIVTLEINNVYKRVCVYQRACVTGVALPTENRESAKHLDLRKS